MRAKPRRPSRSHLTLGVAVLSIVGCASARPLTRERAIEAAQRGVCGPARAERDSTCVVQSAAPIRGGYRVLLDRHPPAGNDRLAVEVRRGGDQIDVVPRDSARRATLRDARLHPPSAAETMRRRDALAAARTKWRASGPAQYEYARNMACFCLTADAYQTVRIRVLGPDSVAEWDSAGRPLLVQVQPSQLTIEGVFDEIERAVETGAEIVDVRYDPALGFPALVELDYIVLASDDDLTLRITDLRPIAQGRPP